MTNQARSPNKKLCPWLEELDSDLPPGTAGLDVSAEVSVLLPTVSADELVAPVCKTARARNQQQRSSTQKQMIETKTSA